jgi:pimeloyl-ACP methyl ester carboxylesterase
LPWLPARLLARDRFENVAKIGQVSAPILILHGKADDLIPFAHAQSLARASPRAQVMAFDGIGHQLAYLDAAGEAELRWLNGVLGLEPGNELKAQR